MTCGVAKSPIVILNLIQDDSGSGIEAYYYGWLVFSGAGWDAEAAADAEIGINDDLICGCFLASVVPGFCWSGEEGFFWCGTGLNAGCAVEAIGVGVAKIFFDYGGAYSVFLFLR